MLLSTGKQKMFSTWRTIAAALLNVQEKDV